MKVSIISLLLTLSFQTALAAQSTTEKQQVIKLEVTDKGFEPSSIHAKPNLPVTLQITRKTDATCATAISIPDKKLNVDLPLNKTIEVKLGKLKNGTLRFTCGMNMMDGAILIEQRNDLQDNNKMLEARKFSFDNRDTTYTIKYWIRNSDSTSD